MFESRFQSFEETTDPSQGAARLAALRAELARRGLDGFVAPRADEHQNEYAPANAERLAWLTGFTGSAGVVIALGDAAALFVDGRYTLQAPQQVDGRAFTVVPLAEASPEKWLEKHLRKGARFGYDSSLHTPAQVGRLEKAVAAAGGELVACDDNPIDVIWPDRPGAPCAPVRLYPTRYAGEAADRKIARVAAALGADALLVSDPHAMAWAFNIRGGDVAHTPLPLGYALIEKNGAARLYLDAAKLDAETAQALGKLATLRAPGDLVADLRAMGQGGRSVRFDSATASMRLVLALRAAGGKDELGEDPIAAMKARKNAAELKGARAAHVRDGVAMVRFLAWFAAAAAKGRLTEIEAAQALETFRRDTGKLADISFPTISAAGANAASPHYRVTEQSNARIARGIYLVDSGAQYLDGTTDITRTLAVGTPSAEMRDRFTRVLKGHIAIARALFPKGTSGAQIDALARLPLWEAGLDFDHGVGHGVGAYLSVHEGPQRISKLGHVALEPGMILSNEPGYYKAGAYGIRIENLIVVAPRKIAGGDRDMLGFDTLTLAPIDRALIAPKLLTREETAWLDDYHARVRRELSPLVDPATRKWLAAATRKLAKK